VAAPIPLLPPLTTATLSRRVISSFFPFGCSSQLFSAF
jgi:hypothetical protein